MIRFRFLSLLFFALLLGAPAARSDVNPSDVEIARALERAARQNRVPSVLLKGLAWDQSRWRQEAGEPGKRVGLLGVPAEARKDAERLASDWRYNIEQGTKALVLSWNRAPIIGNGRLDDGRNILECWYFALGRYGAGRQGEAANAFADQVLNAVASGGNGRWPGVAVTRISRERLARSGLNLFGPPAPWHFGDVLPRPPAAPVVSLAVPYVHQTYDSPDDFNGGGSCGPSSLLMVLAFYQKIAPQPSFVRDAYPHQTNYGALIPAIDDKVCDPNVGAVHAKMLDFLRPHFPGVAIFYDDKARFARVKTELNAGRPVILGTRVTGAGHIMVARGYLADNRLLVNDPAGDREQAARKNGPKGGYSPTGVRYWNGDGDKAVYEWDSLEVRWVMTFGPQTGQGDRPEDEEQRGS